jgi:hypothetical protein
MERYEEVVALIGCLDVASPDVPASRVRDDEVSNCLEGSYAFFDVWGDSDLQMSGCGHGFYTEALADGTLLWGDFHGGHAREAAFGPTSGKVT